MNDTSTSVPGSALLPDGIGTITVVFFVLMAIVAIAAVAMILAGIRRKRLRSQAERQVDQRAEDAGMDAAAVAERVAAPDPVRVVQQEPAPLLPPASAPVPVSEPEPEPEPEPASEPEARPVPSVLEDEPIAAAAPMAASPAAVAADIPAAPAMVAPVAAAPLAAAGDPGEGPLTQLKGLGPKLAERLAGLGVATVGQLAALSEDQATALDAQLGPFTGRMARDRWIEQARLLAAGDRAGFEAVFGRL